MWTARQFSYLALASVFLSTAPNLQNETHASAEIARGRYLVEDVAMCPTCHSPRDQNGEMDRSRWLLGGPVPYRPAAPTGTWADVAPRLSGRPPGTDEDFITLMTTGISRTGQPPRPPMPSFRLSRQDATAVLAYLKSLRSTQ